MERVFLLTKGWLGVGGKKDVRDPEVVAGILYLLLFLLTLQLMYLSQLSDCSLISLNKTFSLDVKPSLSFFSPGLDSPPKKPWELGRFGVVRSL